MIDRAHADFHILHWRDPRFPEWINDLVQKSRILVVPFMIWDTGATDDVVVKLTNNVGDKFFFACGFDSDSKENYPNRVMFACRKAAENMAKFIQEHF